MPSHREIDAAAVVAIRAKLEAMREALVYELVTGGTEGGRPSLLSTLDGAIAELDRVSVDA